MGTVALHFYLIHYHNVCQASWNLYYFSFLSGTRPVHKEEIHAHQRQVWAGVGGFIGFLPLDRILLLAHPLLTQQIQSKEASLLYRKQRAWLENTNARQNWQECSCHSRNTHCLHKYRQQIIKHLRRVQPFSLFQGKS